MTVSRKDKWLVGAVVLVLVVIIFSFFDRLSDLLGSPELYQNFLRLLAVLAGGALLAMTGIMFREVEEADLPPKKKRGR